MAPLTSDRIRQAGHPLQAAEIRHLAFGSHAGFVIGVVLLFAYVLQSPLNINLFGGFVSDAPDRFRQRDPLVGPDGRGRGAVGILGIPCMPPHDLRYRLPDRRGWASSAILLLLIIFKGGDSGQIPAAFTPNDSLPGLRRHRQGLRLHRLCLSASRSCLTVAEECRHPAATCWSRWWPGHPRWPVHLRHVCGGWSDMVTAKGHAGAAPRRRCTISRCAISATGIRIWSISRPSRPSWPCCWRSIPPTSGFSMRWGATGCCREFSAAPIRSTRRPMWRSSSIPSAPSSSASSPARAGAR